MAGCPGSSSKIAEQQRSYPLWKPWNWKPGRRLNGANVGAGTGFGSTLFEAIAKGLLDDCDDAAGASLGDGRDDASEAGLGDGSAVEGPLDVALPISHSSMSERRPTPTCSIPCRAALPDDSVASESFAMSLGSAGAIVDQLIDFPHPTAVVTLTVQPPRGHRNWMSVLWSKGVSSDTQVPLKAFHLPNQPPGTHAGLAT